MKKIKKQTIPLIYLTVDMSKGADDLVAFGTPDLFYTLENATEAAKGDLADDITDTVHIFTLTPVRTVKKIIEIRDEK
jgi:hypothetical protein